MSPDLQDALNMLGVVVTAPKPPTELEKESRHRFPDLKTVREQIAALKEEVPF